MARFLTSTQALKEGTDVRKPQPAFRGFRLRFALGLAALALALSAVALSPSSTVEALAERDDEVAAVYAVDEGCSEAEQRDERTQSQTAAVFGDDLPPVRCISDPYPSFNSVAVDPKNDLVVLGDTNRKSLLVYDRRSGSKSREVTAARQQIMGPKTQVGFVAGVALDVVNREIYAVNNDIEDTMMVFSYDDAGNINPKRLLAVPHQSWGLALSPSLDEIALTIESLDALVFYRRTADKVEPPTRSILGIHTGLADPHGLVLDEKHREIIVTNHGNWAEGDVSVGELGQISGGQFRPPSVTVFDYAAKGDARPLRTIAGDKTLLDWPMGVSLDVARDEILIANNGQNSILIFDRMAEGNTAPKRVIRGGKTDISLPMSVAVDDAHHEIWVANFGDHDALVFDAQASGDVAPKRILRNAPAETPVVGFGNPMAAAYDTKRQEILVPN
jgi:DNA-binding beta-propeller fold protein YncE